MDKLFDEYHRTLIKYIDCPAFIQELKLNIDTAAHVFFKQRNKSTIREEIN